MDRVTLHSYINEDKFTLYTVTRNRVSMCKTYVSVSVMALLLRNLFSLLCVTQLCLASRCNPWSNNTCPIALSDFVQPKLGGSVTEINNTDSYLFTCLNPYREAQLQPYTAWEVNDEEIVREGLQSFIYNQSDSTPVNISCRLSQNSLEYSKNSNGYTTAGPGLTNTPEICRLPKEIVAGSDYLPSCSCVDFKNATYSWKKDGVSLNETGHFLLRFKIKASQSGNYTCNVTLHGVSKESEPYEVVVVDTVTPPRMDIVSKGNNTIDTHGNVWQLDDGGAYFLFCNSPADNGASLYSWTQNGVRLYDVTNSMLTLYQATASDNGFYTCTINLEDKSNTSSRIGIHVGDVIPPSVKTDGEADLFVVGGNYRIECITPLSGWAGDLVGFDWMRNDRSLRRHARYLTLNEIRPKDNGNYTCSVTFENKTVASENDVSVEVTENGKFCTTDDDCTGDAMVPLCQRKHCSCINTYHFKGHDCVQNQGARASITGALLLLATTWATFCMGI